MTTPALTDALTRATRTPSTKVLHLPVVLDVVVDLDAYRTEYGLSGRQEAIEDAAEHVPGLIAETVAEKARQMGTFATSLRRDPA